MIRAGATEHNPKNQNMKKFQFATGLLALGLLASCSSEEPAVTTPDANADGGMYISINLSTPATRADQDGEEGTTQESKITSVKLYMSDETGTIFTGTATDDNVDSEKLKAYFKISEATYNYLAALENEVSLTVVANATPDLTLDNLKTGTTTAQTWTDDSFIMTNNQACKGKLTEAPVDVNGEPTNVDRDNAWKISNSTVVLDRLASRFDFNNYTGITNGVYTSTKNADLKITIEGVAVSTHETETYWFMQSYNSFYKTPLFDGGSAANNKYGVPGDYNWKNLGEKDYARPHTIGEETTATYANAAFVAIKASFMNEKLESMKDGQDVYSYNGYLLGSISEMLELAKTFDPGEDEVLKTVKDFLDGVKELNDQQNSGVQESDIMALGCKKWEKAGEKYYTYYNALVKHEADADTDLKKYAVVRNTIYDIAVKEFAGLGLQAGDEPKEDEVNHMKSLWFNIEMQVRNWTVNNANTNLSF